MNQQNYRLYFIDAMRAWAIIMMLEGHFIDGLLDPIYKDDSSIVYNIWKYFRGVTAPTFFTLSGFIFTYLLIKKKDLVYQSQRINKGLKRVFQLLIIAYLLQLNFWGLLIGEIYNSFYVVNVLHCIAISLLLIIGIFKLTQKRNKNLFPASLLGFSVVLFLFEPMYELWNFDFLPFAIENYFSKVNGSVFTITPWFGYASFGGFLAYQFNKYKTSKQLYSIAIPLSILIGLGLIFFSSALFLGAYNFTGIELFQNIKNNNYLFIRLGDVFMVFAVFMIFRNSFTNKTILKIGASTLSIYVIHFVILYGSFTGLGLYQFLYHSLNPYTVTIGAILFVIANSYLALRYEKNSVQLKARIQLVSKPVSKILKSGLILFYNQSKILIRKLRILLFRRI